MGDLSCYILDRLLTAYFQIVTTYTRNVGLSRFMTAIEKVQYTVDPKNPKQTLAVKEVWIESGLYGVRSAVKNYGIERFKQNCTKATEGFNFVLAQLQSQQHFLNKVGLKKWQEMKERSEFFKETAKQAAAMAKAHSTLHADEAKGHDDN